MHTTERNTVLTAFIVYAVVLAAAALLTLALEDQKSHGRPLLGYWLHVHRGNIEAIEHVQKTVLVMAVALSVIPLSLAAWFGISTRTLRWTYQDLRGRYLLFRRILRHSKRRLWYAICASLVLGLATITAIPLLHLAVQKKVVVIDYDKAAANGLQVAVYALVTKAGIGMQIIPVLLFAYALRKGYRRSQIPGVCRRCGYNLRGCHSERCPECGTLRHSPSCRTSQAPRTL